ncbi:MAG: WYL domain-containing protein [Pedobacter sp.]|nr:MAG: WYL domain-containing protein [Pedobacter sp.]
MFDLEKNEHLKGLNHLAELDKIIEKRRPVCITYHSFKAREAQPFVFHPYFLKEYRNRWFLMGVKCKNEPIMNLALDRIQQIQDCSEASWRITA